MAAFFFGDIISYEPATSGSRIITPAIDCERYAALWVDVAPEAGPAQV
jgi:hypothetical protein